MEMVFLKEAVAVCRINPKRMELDLSRVDYTIVGLTSKNCLKLLPPTSDKEPQKVAVADKDGILQVFSMKKEDISLIFKTLPGPEISSMKLGALSTGTPPDKIFVAMESEVRGYTRKGKLYLTFDSCMTEQIVSMFILGSDLFLCGNHIYNHFRDCKEIGSYLCGDKIIDVVAFRSERSGRVVSLIACEGRMIKMLEHGRVTSSIEVESSPTVLFIFEQNEEKIILFGTIDGQVGVLDVEDSQKFERWIIQNTNNTSSISCLESYEFAGHDTSSIILGREDGNIEIYTINLSNSSDTPALIFSYASNETITALQCGILNTGGFDEVLVSTYSGRIFGLTTEKVEKNVEKNNLGDNLVYSADTTNKISKLRGDIEDLQRKVSKEREKYQSSTQSFFEEYSAIPLIAVNDSFILDKNSAIYSLTIQVPTAIDNILIQSNVPLDLLDVEKNSAVVSYSDCSNSENALLVTYRCQINTNRIEIQLRTIERTAGILKVYVTPMIQPKCSRLRIYEIKPLSYYYRIHSLENSNNSKFNSISFKGTFSLAEIHSWISKCLPEVPEKLSSNETNTLFFKSSMLYTTLECTYKKGEACFKSNNISTIFILKEFVSTEATKKKIKLEVAIVTEDDSVREVIELILPTLHEYQNLRKNVEISEALQELELTIDEINNTLMEKYKKIINDGPQLKREFMKNPTHLNRLYSVVEDLYRDYKKMKGFNAETKVPQLKALLESGNLEAIIDFFKK